MRRIPKSVVQACAGLLVLGTVSSAYAGSALWSLRQVFHAAQTNDVAVLDHAVNWPAVRLDMVNMVLPSATPSDELPDFAASFAEHVATHVLSRDVCPQGMIAWAHEQSAVPAAGLGLSGLSGVHWVSLRRIDATLHSSTGMQIHVRMHLEAWRWRIEHVHMQDTEST